MEPEKKSNGALVGLVVIIIILIVGGIYVWQSNQKAVEEKKNQNQSENVTAQDSVELNTLEANINEVDTKTGVDINTVN